MIRRRWFLLLELCWEFLRLCVLFALASFLFNSETYLDSALMLFLLGVPSLLVPIAFLLLYLDPSNRSLLSLARVGKFLMLAAELLFLVSISIFGTLLAQFLPFSLSGRVSLLAGRFVSALLAGDLIFCLFLLLFKPHSPERRGIPETPVVQIEEE